MVTKNPGLDFSEAQYNELNWVSYLSPEEMGKIAGGLGKFQGENVVAFLTFVKLTGPLPADETAKYKTLSMLLPIIETKRHGYFMSLLSSVKKIVQVENLAESYRAGKISPRLVEILDSCSELDEESSTPFVSERIKKIYRMISEKQIDFESFRGKEDKGDDWLDKYRIDLLPLPYISAPISKLAAILEESKKNTIAYLRAQVKLCLEEEKKADAVDFKSPLPGRVALENFASAIEMQYRERQNKRTRRDYSSPFRKPEDLGFYVNLKERKIYDMRPYSEELHNLFSVKSWRYLKDCAAAIRGEIEDFFDERKKEKPGKKESTLPSVIDKEFIRMFNAPPTNNIISFNSTIPGHPGKKDDGDVGPMEQDLFAQEWIYKNGETEMRVPVKTKGGHVIPPTFGTSSWKLMHFLTLLFTVHNSNKETEKIDPVVEISVREYMMATGKKMTLNNVKDVTKKVKRDLDALKDIQLKDDNKKYRLNRVSLFAGVHLNRGKIRVTLEHDFAQYLARTTGFLMNYPAALLKLKENNPNLYSLGYKLALNRSNDANIRKGKANILSVAVCLDWCPGIPTIEEVKRTHHSPEYRIIEPFGNTLDALVKKGVLSEWEYCLAKGEPLKRADVSGYDYFRTLYVRYEIRDYPLSEELPRIRATQEKREKRHARREALVDKEMAKKIVDAQTAQ